MPGFQNLILLTTGCILTHVLGNVRNDGDACLSAVPWRKLWKAIDRLNNNSYSECIFMKRCNFCDQAQIEQILSNHAAVVQVLNETARLFFRAGAPFPDVIGFLIDISQARDDLKTCLQPNIDLSLHNDRVTECFQHLYACLKNHEDSRCAWQTVSRNSMTLLQRLEFMYLKK